MTVKNRNSLATGIGLALLGLGAATGAQAGTHVVATPGNGLSAKQLQQLEAAGGTVRAHLPQIGVAFVDATDDARFLALARTIGGLQSVTPDRVLQFDTPHEAASDIDLNAFTNPPNTLDNDPLFKFQWGHAAIDAASAWNAGYRGAGAVVAVLDSGIRCNHPDLAPNLIGGASFVPGQTACNPVAAGISSHGSHTSGTVLAADNGIGTIGVAPEAKLLAVKVLSQTTGSGSFAGIIQGIVWSVDNGANVINMSLGVTNGLKRSGPGANEVAELVNLTKRAIQYAGKKEVLVVASAGNDGRDMDHDADVMSFPGGLPGVVTVSALGPEGWAYDFGTDLDVLASYSNYGQSVIHLGAPGGDYRYPGDELCALMGQNVPCWAYDMVLSTSMTGWTWMAGTSMAAPHVAGVAALIYGKHPGIKASQVAGILKRSADDIGKPGQDDSTGAGRVNAAKAVQN